MIHSERLLERFLRYVQIDTTANPDPTTYPSSPGQWELGRMLVAELEQLGAAEVRQDEFGLVWATLPGRVASAPTIAWNAHVDTSPDSSGTGIKPQVWRNYAGGDLNLPGMPGRVIRVSDNPELQQLVGQTIITSDGTTLLGADDKAGIAAIMAAAECLLEHPHLLHGPIKILFTCDEEIGHGVDYVDLERLGATAAYTLDGPGAGQIDVETFSADLAIVLCRGIGIHPSIAKDRLVNAVRAAAFFVSQLPHDSLSPETTSGREGFLHPNTIRGGVEEVELRILLRDFDTPRLQDYAQLLERIAEQTRQAWPRAEVEVRIVEQYRNMGDGLARAPRVVAAAEQAFQRLGITPRREIIRGGTDGSRFTELGLPTPNLSTGEHNPHSPLEWTCLEEMAAAARHLVELAQVWAEFKN